MSKNFQRMMKMTNNFDYLLSLAVITMLREQGLITQKEYQEIDLKNRSVFC